MHIVRSAVITFPDAGILASGSYDNTVRLWPSKVDTLLSMAERLIQRPDHQVTAAERSELGLA